MSGPGLADERVTVFAAASLKDALDDVAAVAPVEMVISYGGSGQIARQVALGAPADFVALANSSWMDWLVSNLPENEASPVNLLSNRLVLVGPADAERLGDVSQGAILHRLQGGRLAVGLTNSVPAGIYARQWLEFSGMWAALQPRLAEVDNVRAALALVARGETPLGVVYSSDAKAEPNVSVVHEIPAEAHDVIIYTVLVLNTKNTAQANELQSFLMGDAARSIFAGHGFLPLGQHP